jgi:hypothetical protein
MTANHVTAMSRRILIMDILPGAMVAIAGVGTIACAVAPEPANAVPLGASKAGQMKVDDLEEAQVVVVGSPHRRHHRRRRRRHHRRWVCWWHRGRRICGWR